VEKIYRNLGVSFNIISEADDSGETRAETELGIRVNEREQSISIKIKTIGADLIQRIREVKASHSGKYWTIQLILPVDDKHALSAYEELVGEGFYFTGVRALCSGTEQIYMQYTGEVYFCFDEFKLTDGFRLLLKDVLVYYERGNQ
ncbi:MAG: hypothetical protein IJT24_05405, partial [Lachnospiraceae bacterium]|nr:hypothetical protein [Lachnospiraceae bacterium]